MVRGIRELITHLSLIPGVGPMTVKRILRRVTMGELEQLAHFNQYDLVHKIGLSSEGAQRIHEGLKDRVALDRELTLCHKHGISLVTILDDEYPVGVKALHAPPPVLYMQGEVHCGLPDTTIALVGSREADRYALECLGAWVPELVRAGYGTVSGGARGADTMVHDYTLQAKGRTTAVLGAGLLRWYPAMNARLFQDIIDKGNTHPLI